MGSRKGEDARTMAIFNFDPAYGRAQVNNEGEVLIPGIGSGTIRFLKVEGGKLIYTVSDPMQALSRLEVTYAAGSDGQITITKIQALNSGGAIGLTFVGRIETTL